MERLGQEKFLICNPETFMRIQANVKLIKSFISKYQWIMDAYVSDFFVQDFWSRLPENWTCYLRSLSPPEISFLLCHNVHTYTGVPPLSLLAYRECVLSFSLLRSPVDLKDEQMVEEIFKVLCSSEHSERIVGKESPQNRNSELNCCGPEVCEEKRSQFTHTSPSDEGYKRTKDSVECCGPFSEKDGESGDGKTCFKGTGVNRHLEERPAWQGVMKNGQWMELEHIYRKHVKPKKQHEIQKLSQAISCLCCYSKSDHVVDVGAGLGHLSRILTFGHGVKVTTVEATGGHAPKAEKFDKQIKQDLRKANIKKQKVEPSSGASDISHEERVHFLSHIISCIHPNISTSEFLALVRQTQEQDHLQKNERCDCSKCQSSLHGHSCSTHCHRDSQHQKDSLRMQAVPFETSDESPPLGSVQTCSGSCGTKLQAVNDSTDVDKREPKNERFVLAGLHACGDLTPTIIRMFVNCDAVCGLASVGCCYMKLSDKSSQSLSPDLTEQAGYPMSLLVQNLADSSLSCSSRELACHFADAYVQRLKDNPDHLKVHCYRAALQHVITSVMPDFQNGLLKLTVKNATDMSFEKYAECAMKKLNYTDHIPEGVLRKAESYLPLWKDVVIFYTLRLCLAPVVETLVLLDRMLFLFEQGIPSVLVPIFNPELSPRNFVLLATKPSKKPNNDVTTCQ